MKGDPAIIRHLNVALKNELTSINQYFVHARMFGNWGLRRLEEHEKHESIDEMKHAEALADRILFLEGLPNFQRLSTLNIGASVPEQFRADMGIEQEAVTRLREGAAYMRGMGDITSAALFESILEDEEHHIDYLETQLGLIEVLGEQLYLTSLIEQPDS